MCALEATRSARLTIAKASGGASDHLAVHHVGVGVHLSVCAKRQCCQDDCDCFFHVYSFVEKSLLNGIADPRFLLQLRHTGSTSSGLL